MKNVKKIVMMWGILILAKYLDLKMENAPSIKKSDLPEDFCDEAAVLVDEFIRKTGNLDYEMLMYFDYSSGEILRMEEGDKCNVEVKFNESEFIEKHVASIHNHPIDVYSPPSGKNFGIVKRDFEDYELIAGCNGLWILEAN